MAKGIIVVESIPESCLSCKRSGYKYGIPACKEKEKQLETFSSKPDWCPIRPMPEKKERKGDLSNADKILKESLFAGWNACIDKILEGE